MSSENSVKPDAQGEEEIALETERFAPESIRDTAVDIEKRCRMCGKNVKGHRRYKDDRGYLCKDCHRIDEARRVPCPECGKPTLPEAMRPWGAISICTACWAEFQNDPQKRVRKQISTRQFEAYEKRTIAIIAIIAAVLLLLMIVGWMTS